MYRVQSAIGNIIIIIYKYNSINLLHLLYSVQYINNKKN